MLSFFLGVISERSWRQIAFNSTLIVRPFDVVSGHFSSCLLVLVTHSDCVSARPPVARLRGGWLLAVKMH
jgi:hypothetical protein